MLLDNDNTVNVDDTISHAIMNSFPYNAFGKDLTVSVKTDERVPPLFMLPPMYNGYTSYPCLIHDDEYEEVTDGDEYLKKASKLAGYMATRSPAGQPKSNSTMVNPSRSSTRPEKNPNTAKSESS